MPETTFHRQIIITSGEKDSRNNEVSSGMSHLKIIQVTALNETQSSNARAGKKRTYFEELKVFRGIFPTKVSFWNLLLRPFIACVTPICLWAGLLYGVAITWLVLIATSVAQIFSAPRERVPVQFMTNLRLSPPLPQPIHSILATLD